MPGRQISVPLLLCLGLAFPAPARSISDEFTVKRQEVFEFAEKPAVTRDGDKVTIAFASKGFCDATVAIEDASGRIIRHLASGVLGSNAPAPFARDSLRQTLLWDGKDDQGRYVDDLHAVRVRVSLGLKPRFERTLFWSPQRRTGVESPIIAAAEEGVYVYGNWDGLDLLRLYDRDGNYVRTIYPFPADRLAEVKGLRWGTDPRDGQLRPRKGGYLQGTLLTSGRNWGFGADGRNEFGETRLSLNYAGPAATAMAAHGDRIALASWDLNRLKSDGSTGGLDLGGPNTGLLFQFRRGEHVRVGPRSMAFSPDGKTLYLTNFLEHWLNNASTGRSRWAHGVAKISHDAAGDAELEVFKGNLSFDDKDAGADADRFNAPVSVDCDAEGNVYVADHLNDRVQVFSASGELLKGLPVERPTHVHVSRRDGSIYVFTWTLQTQFFFDRALRVSNPRVTKFKSLADPRIVAVYPLSLVEGQGQTGVGVRAAVDDWGERPTIWLVPGDAWIRTSNVTVFQYWERTAVHLLREQDGRLVEVRNFGRDVSETIRRHKPAPFFRQLLHVNPRNGRLYLAEGSMHNKATPYLLEIDPDTGAHRQVDVPFDAEDFAFDLNGHAYLRTGEHVARYDPATWREIPWDYGEEVKLSYAGERTAHALSALRTPGHKATARNHNGGMAVSARGRLVVTTCSNQNEPPKYVPRQYPGRYWWGEVHVFDHHGQVVYNDAVPGLNVVDGIGIDRDDNIYVMSQARRLYDGVPFPNPKSETLIKFPSGAARVVSRSTHGSVRVPLDPANYPKRPPDISGSTGIGPAWVEGAAWSYGGVGLDAGGCVCWNARFALDYFARSFAAEIDRYSVAVLDSAGNLVLRVGQYGNVDDGAPLVAEGGPANPRSIGGDEVALFHACYVASDTDRRLFIADAGNARIVSVKLDYHTSETVSLN